MARSRPALSFHTNVPIYLQSQVVDLDVVDLDYVGTAALGCPPGAARLVVWQMIIARVPHFSRVLGARSGECWPLVTLSNGRSAAYSQSFKLCGANQL